MLCLIVLDRFCRRTDGRGGTAENKPGPRSPVPGPGLSPVEHNRVPESYSQLCGEDGGVFLRFMKAFLFLYFLFME